MNPLPTLDMHVHFNPARSPEELAQAGPALGMTFSLQEAAQALDRPQPWIAWGVGCHPREPKAISGFHPARFSQLVEQSAVVGEIGLDSSSRVPFALQLLVFQQVLAILRDTPRIVSIHSYLATSAVLKALRKTPISTPVLHWWTGSEAETRQAVELGCYFSIHPSIARHNKFRNFVPLERLLFESDQGWGDAPASVPVRIGQAETRLARQWSLPPEEMRQQSWRNFTALVQQTATAPLLPPALAAACA